MLEPRGHDGMYGALLVEPDHPEADLAVLFMHNEGYSTMCGHATIALARWAVDSGRVKRQRTRNCRAPAMPLRPGDCAGRGRRHGALRERAGLRLCARPYRADTDLGTGDGRHRLWRRLLCLPVGRFDRPRSALVADARHRRCRRGDRRGGGEGRADRASRRARSRLPLRHHPDRRRHRRRQTEPQRLHLRRPADRSQPDRQRRHGSHGAADGPPRSAAGRSNAGSRAAPAPSSAAASCARHRRSAAADR